MTKKGRIKLIVFIVIALIIANFVIMGIRILKLSAEQSQLEQRNEELQRQKENLQLELDNISTEEYIENLARRNLKLINPDELLYIMQDSSEESSK